MRASRSGRSSQRPPAPEVATLPLLRPDAAGLDIGATQIHVALPPDRGTDSLRVYETFTADLQALADWLQDQRITTVAMESTGVYWIPVFQILEARGFEVCLVNARHVQHVHGRKTDVADCQWLQFLHSVGLLHASFRPPDAVCALRAVLRHRDGLVAQATQHVQHMQKALTQMNLQVHHVLSDLTGQSGLRILDALLAGERDPATLADLRDPHVKAPKAKIMKALQGDWRPELLFVLRQSLAAYRYCQEQLRECDAEIEALLAASESKTGEDDAPPPATNPARRPAHKTPLSLPTADLRTELFRVLGTDATQCPGLGAAIVGRLYAELGANLGDDFPTCKRFTSWTALCPDPRVSGGKVLRHRTRAVPHRVALAFRLAAQSLHHSDTALGHYYRRMRAKLGAPQAITATAHKLARIYYHLVTTGEAYDESVFDDMEAKHAQAQLRRLRQQAAKLGLVLVAETASQAHVS